MKLRWIILIAVGAIALACWTALGLGLVYRPADKGVWFAIVTATAVSSEAFLWVAAGALGWSVLAGRRKRLARWFGGAKDAQN